MNKTLKIGIIAVAVVVVSMFVGCVEEEKAPEAAYPTLTPTPTPEVTESPTSTSTPTPTPTLTPTPSQSPSSESTSSPALKSINRAKISLIERPEGTDDEGYPALKVSFIGSKTTDNLNVTVIKDHKDILGSAIISPENQKNGWNNVTIKIGNYHETIKYKDCKFTVRFSDSQGVLAENTFCCFSGAKVTECPLTRVEAEWEWIVIVEGDKLMKRHFTSSVTCEFCNCGDFPAYIDHATLGGRSIDYPELLLRQIKSYPTSLSGFDLDIGDIIVYDKNGNIV